MQTIDMFNFASNLDLRIMPKNTCNFTTKIYTFTAYAEWKQIEDESSPVATIC